MSERKFLGSISNSALRSLIAKSVPSKSSVSSIRSKSKLSSENIAPVDPNVQISDPPLFASNSIPKKQLSKLANTPIKELAGSEIKLEVSQSSDSSPVKVVVRLRPANGATNGERMVQAVSKDSVSAGDKMFTFDSVFSSNSTQEDVFQSIGIPVVKDALAGYNTSLLAYGQTGSGKTYTLWGPPSAMVETPLIKGLQGLVPRIFQTLFSNIQREQESSDYKQTSYQCRCSFLEIYNERIGDLLDPVQRDLKIKDDAKNGFYVENLTEEYVSTYEDVIQILIKGLSNRKVGSTGINSKSSRSHVVFTCIIESWCKENSSKCFASSKTSRITLVDLAGFERNILEDAGRQYIKEHKFVKKSTSQLGHLVKILSEQIRESVLEAAPYNCSCLTHLLRESLGGNAKLSVICTVSQEDNHMSDTVSTLRFGKKVKLMKNEPVINEITEDDVNGLSDQIRSLKEELIRAKLSSNSGGGRDNGYFTGQSMRDSLNHLRVSLNRSLILPRFDDTKDCKEEEIHINEDDIKELQVQIDSLHNSHDECSNVTDVTSERYISCTDESEDEEVSEMTETALQDPLLSESPKLGNIQRKSLVISSSNTSFNKTSMQDDSRTFSGLSQKPEKENKIVQTSCSSLRSSRIFPGPTESLAASLHRGLQIIDHHQQMTESMRSSSFSFNHFSVKKTVHEASEEEEAQDSCLKTWITPVGGSNNADQVPKQPEALEREKKLEKVCEEQAEKIQKLNQLLSQCICGSQRSVLGGEDIMDDDKKWSEPINCQEKLLEWNGKGENDEEIVKEIQGGELDQEDGGGGAQKCFSVAERDALVEEIEILRTKLRSHTGGTVSNNKSTERLRSSSSMLLLGPSKAHINGEREELQSERERWTEMESEWISLTDELRIDLESIRQRAEKAEADLKVEKRCAAELDDALRRSVVGHARMVEHYVELQEKHNEVVEKHRLMMAGIQEVKMAVARAGGGGKKKGARFAKSLAAELSALRVEREREREILRKENRSLKVQLRDTAEAVHAAGELLVRLREAEETASLAEEKFRKEEEENEKLQRQMEKLKRKHKMEMTTMKQCLAESRLPEAALRGTTMFREQSDTLTATTKQHPAYNDEDDEQAWRAEFGAIYQEEEHHY
ncbi:unnamed protein product [Cuscuta europaea]|uniref:Kinesin motor domain-containing protein n=1 Tax=Cuscuta europaea TaxID=41803 RepID=A0A9P0Z1U6_CUSEU|nr:unnamed protein product [Cuscuta europaea]